MLVPVSPSGTGYTFSRLMPGGVRPHGVAKGGDDAPEGMRIEPFEGGHGRHRSSGRSREPLVASQCCSGVLARSRAPRNIETYGIVQESVLQEIRHGIGL